MSDMSVAAERDDATRKELLEALLGTTRALGGTGTGAVELAEAARTHTGAQLAALWHRDQTSGELTLLVPARDPPPRLKAGIGLAGRCTREAHMLLEVDPSSAPDVDAVVAVSHSERPGAVLSLPLQAGDSVLGVLQLMYSSHAGFDPNTVLLAQVLAAEGALALRQGDRGASAGPDNALHSEVEVARAIQRSTLPTQMPAVPGYDLYGHFQPATYAGGDMFDAVKLPAGVFLLLGDATGHGFGPALSAMEMQGMLRVAFRLGASLDEAFQHVNNQLAEDLAADRFITAFMAFLDASTHEVRYHCAGQGPLLHYHASEDHCDWIQPTTFPVGVMELADAPAASTLSLAPGDILALISDGLYERTDAANAEFGADRVAAVVRAGQDLPMAELCQRLLAAADAFAGGIAAADDVTLTLVRRLPA